jgi:uncharacterized protein (TIRG00374 family)
MDYAIFFQNIQTIHFELLFLAFILNIPMIYFKSMRLQKILFFQNIQLSKYKSFSYYMASLYLGFITPGRIGEFSRVYYIKQKSDKSTAALFFNVLADRLFDLYLLLFLSISALVYLQTQVDLNSIWAGVLLFVLPLMIIKIPFFEPWIRFILRKIFTSAHTKSKHFFEELLKSIRLIVNQSGVLIFFTIVSYAVFFIQCYCIALALNIEIDFITLMLVMAVSNTISLLPISISGIGTRDVTLLYFLVPLGIAKEQVILYASGVLLIFFAGCALMGLYYFLKHPIRLEQIKHMKEKHEK